MISKRWTRGDIASLLAMLDEGYTHAAIGAILGRSRMSIESFAKKIRANRSKFMPPVIEAGRDIRCGWLDGHRPNWTRCTSPVWKHTAWCRDHHKRVYVTRRPYPEF